MPNTIRVKLEGVTGLKEALTELGTVVATKIGVRANRDAAKELQRLLVAAAPYSVRASTVKYWKLKSGEVRRADYGHLRDNIRVRKIKSFNVNTIVHLVSTGDAFWGNFLEFGTVRMAAQPWFRPTLDADYEKIQAIQIEGLRAGVDREVRRIERKNRYQGARARNSVY